MNHFAIVEGTLRNASTQQKYIVHSHSRDSHFFLLLVVDFAAS